MEFALAVVQVANSGVSYLLFICIERLFARMHLICGMSQFIKIVKMQSYSIVVQSFHNFNLTKQMVHHFIFDHSFNSMAYFTNKYSILANDGGEQGSIITNSIKSTIHKLYIVATILSEAQILNVYKTVFNVTSEFKLMELNMNYYQPL